MHFLLSLDFRLRASSETNDFPKKTNKYLLIEPVESFITLHKIGVYADILCKAENFSPVFLVKKQDRKKIEPYITQHFSKFDIIEMPGNSAFAFLLSLFLSLRIWICGVWRRDIITSTRDGYLVGDIIYDQYLAARERATLHYLDPILLKIIAIINSTISQYLALMVSVVPSAVLLSHKVGLSGGTLAWAAERHGVTIYSIAGGSHGTLCKSQGRKDYEFRADGTTLDPILKLKSSDIDRIFDSIFARLADGNITADGIAAYQKKLFVDRAEFATKLETDGTKKNIFLMLHAFTDYPHSHFRGMLFRDYYDWFVRTLEHAVNDDGVNWIVKEHPSAKYYPTTDVNWRKLRQKYSRKHVKFLPVDFSFSAQSIASVGDAVLTCIGSAGFELPALGRVPSITAADNPYATLGFTISPKSQAEYFEVLSQLSSIEKLEREQQLEARAFFIFMHQVSRVSMPMFPKLELGQEQKMQFDKGYFTTVEHHIKGRENEIAKAIERYVEMTKKSDFRYLGTSPQEILSSLG